MEIKHSTTQTMEHTMIEVTWEEIYKRLHDITKDHKSDVKYYGIPRGGQIVAGLTGRAVDNVEDCDIIIDDIYSSDRRPSSCNPSNAAGSGN